jgi:hypothetical protein
MPAIPQTVPGYAHTYHVIDVHDDTALPDGNLYLVSDGRMARMLPVNAGLARAPENKAVWYADIGIGTMVSPVPFAYFGEFRPYSNTEILLLLPGYVPADFQEDGGAWYRRCNEGEPLPVRYRRPGGCIRIRDLERVPDTIRLRRAAPALEALYLEYVLYHEFGRLEPEKEADRQAEEAARRYVTQRLEELYESSGRTAGLLPRPSG